MVYFSAPDSMLTKKFTFQNTAYYADGAVAITVVSDGDAWTRAAITSPSFGITFSGTPYRTACVVTGVKDGGATLTKDTDSPLSWTEDASAAEGSYTLTVTGAGSYADTVSKIYKVQSNSGTFGGQNFTKGSDDDGEYFIVPPRRSFNASSISFADLISYSSSSIPMMFFLPSLIGSLFLLAINNQPPVLLFLFSHS